MVATPLVNYSHSSHYRTLFSEHVCGIKQPNVSLLNLGEEKTKGNMLTQATYSMMKNNTDYHFDYKNHMNR